MSEIVKVCKKHGDLTKEMTCLRKNRKGILSIILCHKCVLEGQRKSYKNNKEKCLSRNLEWTRQNKDKLKSIRDKTRDKNRLKHNEYYRLKYKIGIKNLDDNYIKMILSRYGSLTFADITDDMIFFKRIALQIKRKICEIKYGNR